MERKSITNQGSSFDRLCSSLPWRAVRLASPPAPLSPLPIPTSPSLSRHLISVSPASPRISPPLASPSPMSTRSAHISKERVFFSSKSEIWCNYCVVKLRNLNEASMSAQALKKFVEENQRLAEECTKLLDEVSRLENECSLYEHDRDALMEFANEVEDRAKQAEVRVLEVNDELGRVSKELEFYKKECDKQRGNEARLNEELQLLNERISTIENLRYKWTRIECPGQGQQCQLYTSVPGTQFCSNLVKGKSSPLITKLSKIVKFARKVIAMRNNAFADIGGIRTALLEATYLYCYATW